MKTVTLRLSADTEQKLRDKARKLGQTLEVYLQQLAESAVENGTIPGPARREGNGSATAANESEEPPKFVSRPKITAEEMEDLLDLLSAGPAGKILPPEFSRADIYTTTTANAYPFTAYPLWRQLVVIHSVQGKEVHDARLAALMQAHAITHILNLNGTDFTRYPRITPIDPSRLAAPPPLPP
jgi:hypothetical protein